MYADLGSAELDFSAPQVGTAAGLFAKTQSLFYILTPCRLGPKYFYLPAATVLKRWAGDTANAVFVHVDESLHGMDVIRAFQAVDYFIQVGFGMCL
jgi:hypothetical protein